jgi:hypothetical protein
MTISNKYVWRTSNYLQLSVARSGRGWESLLYDLDSRYPTPGIGHHAHTGSYSTRAYRMFSRLGGVVVSVLATGTKGRGFKPAEAIDFLREIKIRSTPSFRW